MLNSAKDGTYGIAHQKPYYPYHEWEIIEDRFEIENNYRNETVFSLGNGYLGLRGTFEEGYCGPHGTSFNGTYINGFYDTTPLQYGEKAYGFPDKTQTMLNVTNGKIIKLFLEDEEFNMLKGKVDQYRRSLNFREGFLRRSLIWTSPKGKAVKIEITRLVSLINQHLAAINYKVTPLNFDGEVRLVSALDGNVQNLTAEKDPRVGSGIKGKGLEIESVICEGHFGILIQKTARVQSKLACAMENQLITKNPYEVQNSSQKTRVEVIFRIDAQKGRNIILNKYLSYITSRDPLGNKLFFGAKKIVSKAKSEGFAKILKEQKDYFKKFWDKTDVIVKGDPAIQQGIRFNMFHLLQSTGKDGKTSIGAKGLTGEGYEGHYFWDAEMYVLPFFLYTNPELSRKLLEYRYHTLDKARERARQMAHEKGALFPWRTINGEECSAFFPAGTAQYHINADIAFAVKRYVEATGDDQFLIQYGAEILFETARIWADLGEFIPKRNYQFCINGVTGPDEYTAIVNNNFYTNIMARENLDFAYRVALWMKNHQKEAYEDLVKKIGLDPSELELWRRAADNMYLPYDEDLGIYTQDDSFLSKAVWDFAKYEDKKPLLIHFHPLVIYRYQVCKQADTLLALFFLDHQFGMEEKKRNYDYYQKITTHDSSLSKCIFSIIAFEIGYYEQAYQYFLDNIRMDLDDTQGNVSAGIHVANMAGSWMGMVNGIAGMRVHDGRISFNPYLPEQWEEYSFKITYQGKTLSVKVKQEGAQYELLEGDELSLIHKGREIIVKNSFPQLICS